MRPNVLSLLFRSLRIQRRSLYLIFCRTSRNGITHGYVLSNLPFRCSNKCTVHAVFDIWYSFLFSYRRIFLDLDPCKNYPLKGCNSCAFLGPGTFPIQPWPDATNWGRPPHQVHLALAALRYIIQTRPTLLKCNMLATSNMRTSKE